MTDATTAQTARAEARGALERLCWRLSGWQVEQRSVDELLAAADVYAGLGTGVEPQAPRALDSSGGAGAAVRPADAPESAPKPQDIPEPVTGPQTGVQHVHVTGTLTLVCPQPCTAHAPAPAAGKATATDTAPPRDTSGRFTAKPRPDTADGQRMCRKCNTLRPISDFSRDAKGNDGRRYACRECENTRKREADRAKRQQKAQAA